MAHHGTTDSHRIQTMMIRIGASMMVALCFLTTLAMLFLAQASSGDSTYLRLFAPLVTMVSHPIALLFVWRGWPRTGVAVSAVIGYVGILYYSILTGYGIHAYAYTVFAIIIMTVSLGVGPRAGLVASVVATLTVIVMYQLETRGMVVNMEAVHSLPPINIAIAYCAMFMAAGSLLYLYSVVFRSTLRAADEQEHRFRLVIEASPLGQLVHRGNVVLMINKTAAAIVGRSAESLSGVRLDSFLSKGQADVMLERIRSGATLKPGENITAQFSFNNHKGEKRQFETLTSPVDFVDGPALLTVMRDVTEERAAAAALARAKADAESANRIKSQFLANMSHEIRTPMNAVLGLSELLVKSGLAGSQLHYAQNIHNSADSLLSVINDVLDVSRIEAGHFELSRKHFMLRPLLERVRTMLLPLAEAKRLTFEVHVDSAVPGAFMGDEGRLQQIVVNLAGNAIKFTNEGRVDINVRLAPEVIGTEVPKEGGPHSTGLCIRVTDSGLGIPPDKMGQLFQRFMQVDDSDTRKHRGTGLGLYIVRELAERMGGGATGQSLVGAGSTFEVRLRLDLPTAIEVAQAAPVVPAAPRTVLMPSALTVLIVDDDETNRMLARTILKGAGHQSFDAADGAEAVARHATQQFDCILMDWRMPVMDGLEAARRIRAREAAEGAPRTPIVGVTASALDADRHACMAAGMDAVLIKPYKGDALFAALNTALQSRVPAADPAPALSRAA